MFSSAAALPSIAGTLVLLLITIPLGTWLVIRVPPTFSVGPTVEESHHPCGSRRRRPSRSMPLAGTGRRSVKSSEWTLHWVLFRGLKTNVLIWFLLGIVGASVAVATLEFLKGTNAFMPLFFIVIYHLPLLQGALESMTPYRFTADLATRPVGAHRGTDRRDGGSRSGDCLVDFHAQPASHSPRSTTAGVASRCPGTTGRSVADGRDSDGDHLVGRELHAKGASTVARRHHRSLRPLRVGPESSPRFVEYQMRRASHAVYGDPLPKTFSSPGLRAAVEHRRRCGEGDVLPRRDPRPDLGGQEPNGCGRLSCCSSS